MVYTYDGILLSFRTGGNSDICGNMEANGANGPTQAHEHALVYHGCIRGVPPAAATLEFTASLIEQKVNKHLFSYSSGSLKSKIKVPAIWFLRPLVLACRQPPSCCVLTQPFLCTKIPGVHFLIRPSFNLNNPLKALSSNIVTLGVRASGHE